MRLKNKQKRLAFMNKKEALENMGYKQDLRFESFGQHFKHLVKTLIIQIG